MTPFFRFKISSQLHITEEDQHQPQISSSSSLGTSSTCTSQCPPFLFDSQQDHKALDGALHEEIKGSTWCNYGINHSSSDLPQEPVKWMSSKMRIMRKMINSYQTPTTKPRRCTDHHLLQDKKKANLDSIIRVCSDCNTTKTPLWRSGPCGPKSLCNACGIRQRKARRAMAASVMKDKASSEVDRTVPFKKRCRFSAAAAASVETPHERKLCFEDIVIRLSQSSAFHRVFPQDEKDAAILLMALSSGLLCS